MLFIYIQGRLMKDNNKSQSLDSLCGTSAMEELLKELNNVLHENSVGIVFVSF